MGQVIDRTGMEGKAMSPTMPGTDTIAARRMLVAYLVAFTDPGPVAEAVVADIIEQGGTLSIADERAKRAGRHRVLLRLHGLTVGEASLEEAAVNWRDAAHASLSGETAS